MYGLSKFQLDRLVEEPKRWLITGVAGFIGSHLLEALLKLQQNVVGIDNFENGYEENINEVLRNVSAKDAEKFQFVEADICDFDEIISSFDGCHTVLHHAALGSVPRSIDNPLRTNKVNVSGFLNVIEAARRAKCSNFIYAASSSTYGDSVVLPKVESEIGLPLSPYALTKLINEQYAEIYSRVFRLNSIGLRYFNIFGPRQSPNGAYAAVIPRWIDSVANNSNIKIFGDGETTRDFTYVENVVQANLKAALSVGLEGNNIFNVACGNTHSLNRLSSLIIKKADEAGHEFTGRVERLAPRPGDVTKSLASIKKADEVLGYRPSHQLGHGLDELIAWYFKDNFDE